MTDDTAMVNIRLRRSLLKRLDHRVVEANEFRDRLTWGRAPVIEALLTRVLDAIDRGEVVP